MAIPPVPGKKLKKAQPAPKKARQHSAAKKKAPAKKVATRNVAGDASPAKKVVGRRVPVDSSPAKKVAARRVAVDSKPAVAPAVAIPVVAGKEKRRQKDHGHKALHRVLVGANIFLALCVLTAAGGYGYLKFRIGQLDRISLGCQVLRNCGDDDPDKPMNVLLVGSDTRAEISKAERAKFGNADDVGGERTDTMMVLHIDPIAGKASILSIPRDLYVPIAGTNQSDRINTAYALQLNKQSSSATTARKNTSTTSGLGGASTTLAASQIKDGPERLIATIRQNLGIEIDHYIEVDFNSFRSIVNAVGGVVVPFPAPARDKLAGLDVKTAGCVNLTGDQALGYVRSRHFQYFEAGRWKSDPTGDIGRIARQQDFIRRMLRKAISKGIRNPIKLNALVSAGVGNVKLDSALSTKDIVRIGKQFKSLEPESVNMQTLPASGFRTPAGAAVLRLNRELAQVIIDRFNGVGQVDEITPGAVPAIATNTVRVTVLNGTGVNGQAGKTLKDLTNVGFGAGGVGDAAGFDNATTQIRYADGQLQKAQLLQAYVVGGAKLVLDNTLKGGNLQLVLGATFSSIRSTITPPGGSTSSAPSTTSTTQGAIPTPKGAVALAC